VNAVPIYDHPKPLTKKQLQKWTWLKKKQLLLEFGWVQVKFERNPDMYWRQPGTELLYWTPQAIRIFETATYEI